MAGRAISFIQEIITSAARTVKRSILLAELFFAFVALAHQLDGSRAQCFGNVFIHAKLFEVGRIEHGKEPQRAIQRRFAIVQQVANDVVILRKFRRSGGNSSVS